MNPTLRLLLIEDSEPDAALILLHISRGGYNPLFVRVSSELGLRAELDNREWDVVIADYAIPGFGAREALRIVRESGLDIPFLVVSGAIDDETAVKMMRLGAHDYILKGKLTRLVPVIEREIRDARERKAKRNTDRIFQAILESTPDPSAVIDLASNTIVDASQSFRKLTELDSVSGTRLFEAIEFSHPERIAQLLERRDGSAWGIIYRSKGETRVANARLHTVDEGGSSFAYLVLEDVTEQHHLKAAFDAAPNAVLILSSASTLLYANRAAEELFGALYFGMDVTPLLAHSGLAAGWWMHPTPRYGGRRLEIRETPYEASTVSVRFAGENNASSILTLRSMAEEEELLHLANHDALTGLCNLRDFRERLNEQLAAVRAGGEAALAILDLDDLKPINDSWGHPAGDAALISFANLVRHELTSDAIVARIGGDEFAILFPSRPLVSAESALARLFTRIASTPFVFDGNSRPLSASVGLTRVGAGDSYESVKARADQLLYRAKRAGKGRLVADADDLRRWDSARKDGGGARPEEPPQRSRPA